MNTATLIREQYIGTNDLNDARKGKTFQKPAVNDNPKLEYRKTQLFLAELASLMLNQHKLDVSFEVSEAEQETVLSWASKDLKTTKSLCAFYDENEFGIQLSTIKNGRRAGEEVFSSLTELKMDTL